MILAGATNSAASKIELTVDNLFTPIKIGNDTGLAVQATKIFIGDSNGKAKEIYFIPLYDYRHKFIESSFTAYLTQTDLVNIVRNPANPRATCDLLLLLNPSMELGYIWYDSDDVAEDIEYYSRIIEDKNTIKNVCIGDMYRIIDNVNTPFTTLPNIEYLYLSTWTKDIRNAFNSCNNLKAVVFHSEESLIVSSNIRVNDDADKKINLSVYMNDYLGYNYDYNYLLDIIGDQTYAYNKPDNSTSTPNIENSFGNMFNGSYILVFDSNIYNEFITNTNHNTNMTIVYKANMSNRNAEVSGNLTISLDSETDDKSISSNNFINNVLGGTLFEDTIGNKPINL